MCKKTTKHINDYKLPVYFIDVVDLYIDIQKDITIVTNKMQLRRNTNSECCELVLNGECQNLKVIKLDDKELGASKYKLTKTNLILTDLPEKFSLEIQSTNNPDKNTELTGLYKANNMYCTQCEPEGFRRITYFIDRPDVLSRYTTTICAEKYEYPVLLSNGNLIDSGELLGGRHWMKWEDPHPKPCYLFAMVAGNLDYIEDHFITCSNREITLRIFSEKGQQDKCLYAMQALKKSMRWDEENYGREYDLDMFMIVAVSFFNSGAMENKGLNIFNTKYIYVNPETATDDDYFNVDRVIAHEYFHNWSGNRVTCRDWFQLSLKEGFTVFRDQSFSEDINDPAKSRIEEVQNLRLLQFPEDAGPLAHPVRPDTYIEINNFYTTTVYEKGAEVIRMLVAILGKEKFREGTDLYFSRHDGQAVTCDDFVRAMEDVSKIDLTQFKLWYSQSGTPKINITDFYDSENKKYQLNISQCFQNKLSQNKKPMQIPIAFALFNSKGEQLLFKSDIDGVSNEDDALLNMTRQQEIFVLEDVDEKPIPSFLRGFSAPVKIEYNYSDEALSLLMKHESDSFAKWEAGQLYSMRIIRNLIDKLNKNEDLILPEDYLLTFRNILLNKTSDKSLVAQMLILPSEIYIAELMDVVAVDETHEVRQFIQRSFAEQLKLAFLQTYKDCQIEGEYCYTIDDVAKRKLKNVSLQYLMLLDDQNMHELAMQQFSTSNNMTDQLTALRVLANTDCKYRQEALQIFYQKWNKEDLVIDKWFAVQAKSILPDTLITVKDLLKHKDFSLKKPNRVYALLRSFAMDNPARFHEINGQGYQLLADQILKLDKMNPQVAARLMRAFTQWQRYDEKRKSLMHEQLKHILATKNLSNNVNEIVCKSLSV